MFVRTWPIVALLSVCLLASGQDEVSKIKSQDANTALSKYEQQHADAEKIYEREVTRLTQAFEKRVRELRSDLLKSLAEAQREVATRDLDDAVRIRDTAQAIDASPIPVPGSQEAGKPTRAADPASQTGHLEKEAIEDEESKVAALPDELSDAFQKIAGKSYVITLKNGRKNTWTFQRDGKVVGDIKNVRFWGPCGPRTIAVVSTDGSHVDAVFFNEDFTSCVLCYMGDARSVEHRTPARLAK